MFSKTRYAVFGFLVLFAANPAWAENVYTCPDISKAVKVGECPTDGDLKRMFSSTCGSRDTENEIPGGEGVCRSFKLFKKAKNTSLWESADAKFEGYLSCDAKESDIKAGKLVKISTAQKRQWDRVICTYDSGAELVLRTLETCKVPGAKLLGRYMGRECEAGDAECKAVCK